MSDLKKYLYSYRAFGLNILSQFTITGFELSPVEKADVHIQEGSVPEVLDKVINKGVLYESNDSEFLLQIEKVAAYYVRNGNEIIVQRLGQTSDAEVSAFLIGTSFGALLHQRKQLPLHASTVVLNNKCFVIAGASGAGKTTLAAAIVKAGGLLVADDISMIDFSGEKPAVCPAFPTIKIWEDSLKHLGISSNGLEPVRGELKKYYLPIDKFSRKSNTISHIFILQYHNLNYIEKKNLHGVEKFQVLKKHTYLFRGVPKTKLENIHFMLTSNLASQIPVTVLIRPNDKFNTGKLVDAIAETF